jgi:hypothetical protein
MGLRWPQRCRQNGATLRPSIKGRIPPINGSIPVALYQWNLLERQKPGIPLIKGIATAFLIHVWHEKGKFSNSVAGRDHRTKACFAVGDAFVSFGNLVELL